MGGWVGGWKRERDVFMDVCIDEKEEEKGGQAAYPHTHQQLASQLHEKDE